MCRVSWCCVYMSLLSSATICCSAVCVHVLCVLAGSGLDTRSRCMSEHALHCSRRPVSRAVRVTHASTEVTDSDLRQLDSSETSTPYLVRASPVLPVEDTIYSVRNSVWQKSFIYKIGGCTRVLFGTHCSGSTRNSNLQNSKKEQRLCSRKLEFRLTLS